MMQFLSLLAPRKLFIAVVSVFISTSTLASSVPRFAYIANPYDYTVSGYYINSDGLLIPNGTVFTGDKYPSTIAISPSKKFLYVASRTVDIAQIYRIDPVTGRLTETPESGFQLKVRSPFHFAMHPSGKFLYVAARGGSVGGYTVNPETGALGNVPHSPFAAGERTRNLIVHPSGKYLYATNAYTNNISAYRIDQHTGELHELKHSPFFAGETGPFNEVYNQMPDVRGKGDNKGGMPYFITSHPSGKFLYVSNYAAGTISVFTVDPDSGDIKLQGSTVATGYLPYAVAFNPSGTFFYVTAWGKNELWSYSVNQQTGGLTPLANSPLPTIGDKPVDISISDDGTHVYVANNKSNSVTIVDVDSKTGNTKLQDFAMTHAGAIDIELLSLDTPVSIHPGFAFVLDKQHEQLKVFRVNEQTGDLHEVAHAATGKKPTAIGRDPLNRFVYVTNSGSNTVSAYSVDHVSGALQEVEGSPYQVGKQPIDVIVDANGWYLYTINQQSKDMSVFLIHYTKGQLAEAQGSPVPLGKQPLHISGDVTSRFIYVSSAQGNTVNLFHYRSAITPSIFDTDQFGSPYKFEAQPSAVVNDPSGRYMLVLQQQTNQVELLFVHDFTGQLLHNLQHPQIYKLKGKKPIDAVFHPNGRFFYVLNQQSRTISQLILDRNKDVLNRLASPISVYDNPHALVMDPAGQYMYVLSDNASQLQKYRIDSKTGQLTEAGIVKLSFVPQAMAISREIQ